MTFPPSTPVVTAHVGKNGPAMCWLWPSSDDGKFYMTIAHCGLCETSARAIGADVIRMLLSMCFDAPCEQLDWHPCEPGIICEDNPNQDDSDEYVYFILCEDADRIKIGVAQNPHARLRTLQCGSPHPLTLMGAISGGYELEQHIHSRFRHLRVQGEWFHAAPELWLYFLSHGFQIEDHG